MNKFISCLFGCFCFRRKKKNRRPPRIRLNPFQTVGMAELIKSAPASQTVFYIGSEVTKDGCEALIRDGNRWSIRYVPWNSSDLYPVECHKRERKRLKFDSKPTDSLNMRVTTSQQPPWAPKFPPPAPRQLYRSYPTRFNPNTRDLLGMANRNDNNKVKTWTPHPVPKSWPKIVRRHPTVVPRSTGDEDKGVAAVAGITLFPNMITTISIRLSLSVLGPGIVELGRRRESLLTRFFGAWLFQKLISLLVSCIFVNWLLHLLPALLLIPIQSSF